MNLLRVPWSGSAFDCRAVFLLRALRMLALPVSLLLMTLLSALAAPTMLAAPFFHRAYEFLDGSSALGQAMSARAGCRTES